MSPLARAAGVAAVALAFVLAASVGRAELVPGKFKYALLDSASDSTVTDGFETTLFFEDFALKGKPGCVFVRYSGELSGSDGDADLHVAATFKVYIGEVEVEPYPRTHEATTTFPQIVSFSAFACGVAAGRSGVLVTVKPNDEDDVVAVVYRTLEVWTERPILSSPLPVSSAASTGPLRPNVLKAKRTFVASSEDTLTARVDPVSVFDETVVLTGRPSCLCPLTAPR